MSKLEAQKPLNYYRIALQKRPRRGVLPRITSRVIALAGSVSKDQPFWFCSTTH